jgi:hypothetical protein
MSGAALVRPSSRGGFLPPTPIPSPKRGGDFPWAETAWGEGRIEAGEHGAVALK